ncbi:MAG: hypothetical protein ACE5I1_25560 [bacterium]
MQQYPYGPKDVYPEELREYNEKYNTRKVTTERFQRLLRKNK